MNVGNHPLFRAFPHLLVPGMVMMLSLGSLAQPPQPPLAPAQFDPSDVYFQGYLASRAAEKLEQTGDFIAAAEKYRKADELFSTVRQYYPDWKSDMVQRRSAKTSEALAAVSRKAEEMLARQRDVVAELEGGVRMGTRPEDAIDDTPRILKVDPVASRRLDQAEQEVRRLREQLAEHKRRAEALQQQQQRSSGKATEQWEALHRESTEKLAAARAEVDRLKAQAAMQEHHKLDAQRTARLLEAEKEKVARLQQEALEIRQRAAARQVKDDQLTSRQLAEAKAEIRRLEHEATMARVQAETEINRLRKLTGEMQAEAKENVERHQELARNAKQNAEAEIQRMQNLTGSEREQAQKEIERLQRIAAKAQADANAEIAQLKQITETRQSETQAEIERLREIADQASKQAAARQLEYDLASNRDRTRIKQLEQEQATLKELQQRTAAELKAAESDVSQLKARLAKAPLESEVEGLNLRIRRLEQERGAMAMALRQSETGHAQAMEKIDLLEAELGQARQQAADLNRNLRAERDAANQVVAGQRRQLEALQKQLEEKSEALTAANRQIKQLQRELSESQEAYTQLRQERDALITERDQMAALLKLNEDGRIQDLIEQNMGLARKLREADESLKRMQRESNVDKDAITESLRDLAMAKFQINRLRQEQQAQQQRIVELEERLQQEQQALASGQASSDPHEVEVLRDIIRRQLRMQKARRQARELLVNAVKALGNKDEQLAEAAKLFEAQEIILTPEERKLVADRQVDVEFVSPFARSQTEVNQATAGLKRDIDVFDRAARKAFVAGRLMPTRELYEMILDQHPGHIPTLCKIGVVQLKLNQPQEALDSFQRASELEPDNAYTLRMMGYALMRCSRLEEAEATARRAVELDPTDAKTHMLLATLCYHLGKSGDAESHFKGAINADPMPSEPYYNLALIYSGSGRIEQAQEYYRQALERGALPDPKLEKELAAQ